MKRGDNIALNISADDTYTDVEHIWSNKIVFVEHDYEKHIADCANGVVRCTRNAEID